MSRCARSALQWAPTLAFSLLNRATGDLRLGLAVMAAFLLAGLAILARVDMPSARACALRGVSGDFDGAAAARDAELAPAEKAADDEQCVNMSDDEPVDYGHMQDA